jgi:hypothetical protein
MKLRLSFRLGFWRFFLPDFVTLLTLRMLYVHGYLQAGVALIAVAIIYVGWFLSGGIPAANAAFFVTIFAILFVFYWFLFFPDTPPPALRGRTLQHRGKNRRTGTRPTRSSSSSSKRTPSFRKKGR